MNETAVYEKTSYTAGLASCMLVANQAILKSPPPVMVTSLVIWVNPIRPVWPCIGPITVWSIYAYYAWAANACVHFSLVD
ncbi:hypothetical protein Gbro_1449 [Gordonia bronchialis DSM 43247]|uniref:Uncharacterized protein n=1 Tax=Gordonia bronchialis (strain ATCC 25592 / DSM 43247 / BCRC 13721 / JCM 3198 / KCTC 3076 / NBRC 16047 / NCTC 10667) TaxID=526226 RepID=D0L6H3_GORB4|nr:hypothetical protein Gbro_1449 [Gordonia bronchialis DSM 43247]STQ63561.1 Uncharacterised protein [Gordonia bronchialis]